MIISEHSCILETNWDENSDWISFDMEFNNLHKNWSIKVSKQSIKASIPVLIEPTSAELTQWQEELKQVGERLRDALIYLMNIFTISKIPRSPVKYTLMGPGYIKKNAPIQCSYTVVLQNSSPPSIYEIKRFWLDLDRNEIYQKAVVYYLKALSVKSESDEDHELYKALELFKNLYHGWEKAADNIGYPFSKWKNLKYNLNRHRHFDNEQDGVTKIQAMSRQECFVTVKEIIELFRQKKMSSN